MGFFGNRDPRAFMPMLQAVMSGQIPGVTVEDPYAMAQALGIPSPGSFGGPPAVADASPGAYGGPPASQTPPPLKIAYDDSSGPVADAGIDLPDYMGGINDALAQNAALGASRPKKSGGFGGFLRNWAGYLGDNLTGNPVYADSLKHKRRLEEIEREAQLKAKLPQQVGSSVIVPDGQGGYKTLFRDPSTPEAFALAQGLKPGTPEYAEAVRQYRLGSWSDEALEARIANTGYRYDRQGQLQEDRQGFSRSMQEDRQSHSDSQLGRRLSAPPRQRPSQPKPPTPNSVIGRLMDKQAAGKPLTPAEQRTYDEYRAGRGKGSRASSAGDLVGPVYQKGGRRIQYSKKAGGYIDLATGQRVQ